MKVLKLINYINILEIIAWILAYKNQLVLCLLLVIISNILENYKENKDMEQIKQLLKERSEND